ncbi:hypothetical protein SAMN02745127_02089 [Oceanospirillum multiglobuliferum]|uniref:Uncharacterized protein n=1 Tax=Oceanospirillum multiglobuliferum TaxID=64969 RepID=A0A1T4QZ23_9GAMM|nr:hypothetical protein [Oceanospirillum multiglobuliferum]OPX57051.1 hypothetical protein BTE48_01070 [Oceanospirillum multiglobuliferum]SKA08905.1 hypothetical protein SAMN02745127_02089 [Oceanospirillum multiglobuliferum]
MMLRCPSCHVAHSLEQVVNDEAARELMALMGDLPKEISRPLVAYLGLFRSKSRALAWERALRLCREVVDLSRDGAQLGAALSETVESLRAKQQQGGWQPLTGHNYLKRVLENREATPMKTTQLSTPIQPVAVQTNKSATRSTISQVLNRWQEPENSNHDLD